MDPETISNMSTDTEEDINEFYSDEEYSDGDDEAVDHLQAALDSSYEGKSGRNRPTSVIVSPFTDTAKINRRSSVFNSVSIPPPPLDDDGFEDDGIVPSPPESDSDSDEEMEDPNPPPTKPPSTATKPPKPQQTKTVPRLKVNTNKRPQPEIPKSPKQTQEALQSKARTGIGLKKPQKAKSTEANRNPFKETSISATIKRKTSTTRKVTLKKHAKAKAKAASSSTPFTAAMLSIEAAQCLPPVPTAAQDPPPSCRLTADLSETASKNSMNPGSLPLKDCESRSHVSKWLLASEKSYVWALSAIVDLFLVPLQEGITSSKSKVLNSKDLENIFGFIEELHRVHRAFLGKVESRVLGSKSAHKNQFEPPPSLFAPLSTRGKTPNSQFLETCKRPFSRSSRISDLFFDVNSLFERYGPYLYRLPNALRLLEDLIKVDPGFKKMVQDAQSHPRCQKQTLFQLLSRPVWRLPQYLMCVMRLVSLTADGDDGHPDAENTLKAFRLVRELCASTDLFVKRLLNSDHTKAIQKCLVSTATRRAPRLLGANRVFVCNGPLVKICRKGPKPRQIFLFSNLLIYAQPLPNRKFLLSMSMPISDILSISPTEKHYADLEHGLIIRSKQKSFTCYANTAEIKQFWIDCLTFQKALVDLGLEEHQRPDGTIPAEIMQQVSKAQNEARSQESKSQSAAPVWVTDHEAKQCQICKSDFTFTKRRHHCRQCGRVVCDTCSRGRLVIRHIHPKKLQRVCDECTSRVSN